MLVARDRQSFRRAVHSPEAQPRPLRPDRADAGKVASGASGQPFQLRTAAGGDTEQELVVLPTGQGQTDGIQTSGRRVGPAGWGEGKRGRLDLGPDSALFTDVHQIAGE